MVLSKPGPSPSYRTLPDFFFCPRHCLRVGQEGKLRLANFVPCQGRASVHLKVVLVVENSTSTGSNTTHCKSCNSEGNLRMTQPVDTLASQSIHRQGPVQLALARGVVVSIALVQAKEGAAQTAAVPGISAGLVGKAGASSKEAVAQVAAKVEGQQSKARPALGCRVHGLFGCPAENQKAAAGAVNSGHALRTAPMMCQGSVKRAGRRIRAVQTMILYPDDLGAHWVIED